MAASNCNPHFSTSTSRQWLTVDWEASNEASEWQHSPLRTLERPSERGAHSSNFNFIQTIVLLSFNQHHPVWAEIIPTLKKIPGQKPPFREGPTTWCFFAGPGSSDFPGR